MLAKTSQSTKFKKKKEEKSLRNKILKITKKAKNENVGLNDGNWSNLETSIAGCLQPEPLNELSKLEWFASSWHLDQNLWTKYLGVGKNIPKPDPNYYFLTSLCWYPLSR